MNYIKKIVGNFTDDNFEKIINNISQKFQFMYVDDTLFLALKAWTEYEGSEDLISKTFRPVKDFYIEELDKTKIEKQQQFIKDWCSNHSIRLDRERYELENQEKLKQAWASMDELEEKLKQIALENETRKEESNGESNK